MNWKRAFAAAAGAAFLALLVFGVTGCSDSTTPPNGTSQTFTSTTSNAHSHTVVIQRAEVATPPVIGITKTTSSVSAHTHTFDMTEAQLTTVLGGTGVTVTTGNSDTGGAHTHNFTITKWF
jgi:hypothetical protein